MEKMWAGRFAEALDQRADDFNSSISFDSRMFRQDIRGSMAHAMMLGTRGIISESDVSEILSGLESILSDLESGALAFDILVKPLVRARFTAYGNGENLLFPRRNTAVRL